MPMTTTPATTLASFDLAPYRRGTGVVWIAADGPDEFAVGITPTGGTPETVGDGLTAEQVGDHDAALLDTAVEVGWLTTEDATWLDDLSDLSTI